MVGAVGVGDVAVGMEADMEEIDTITEAAAAAAEVEEEDTGDLLDLLHHNHLRLIWDTVMAPATQLADTGRHRLLSLPLPWMNVSSKLGKSNSFLPLSSSLRMGHHLPHRLLLVLLLRQLAMLACLHCRSLRQTPMDFTPHLPPMYSDHLSQDRYHRPLPTLIRMVLCLPLPQHLSQVKVRGKRL